MRGTQLFNANHDLADVCLSHRFVQGIASGNLERARFVDYVAQDAFFLAAFAKAYASAQARSMETPARQLFQRLGEGVANELNLHREYAAQWGIELTAVSPQAATTAYTSFLDTAATCEAVPQIAAAMAPCLRLYAWLGQQLQPTANPASPYHAWVRTYADPAIDLLAGELEAVLDWPTADHARQSALYRRAMHLDLALFDAFR